MVEEEMLSILSNSWAKTNQESSESNCSLYTAHTHKSPRIERFKGVVQQQNGHWGAQIYSNHQRIWLGTFKSEIDAAIAYDSAAMKLRNGDSHRNFPLTNITLLEPKFQSHFSTDVVLNMIRDGSYPSKFANFLKNQQGGVQLGLNISSIYGDGEFSCTLLFQKELTPSDVGKLNRLVIPKRYAIKNFPNVPDPSECIFDGGRADEVQLEFCDREMNLWKFRYCYWRSSQSFVFTRGWNKFVKEKGLRAKDTICFYSYESRKGRPPGQSFLVIDVASKDVHSRNNNITRLDLEVKDEKLVEAGNDKTHFELLGSAHRNEAKGFKLFGVQID